MSNPDDPGRMPEDKAMDQAWSDHALERLFKSALGQSARPMTATQIAAIVQRAARLKDPDRFPLLSFAGCIVGLISLVCLGLLGGNTQLPAIHAILVLAPLANLVMSPLAAYVIIKNATRRQGD
jgi:hypothetical protein